MLSKDYIAKKKFVAQDYAKIVSLNRKYIEEKITFVKNLMDIVY